MPKAGGEENFYVAAEEDDGESRIWWKASGCPLAEVCSVRSFENSKCTSLVSEAQCREYVVLHLRFSGKHFGRDESTEEAADHLATLAEITEHVDTYEDREAYRHQCAQAQAEESEPPRKKICAPSAKHRPLKARSPEPRRLLQPQTSAPLATAAKELASAARSMVEMQQSMQTTLQANAGGASSGSILDSSIQPYTQQALQIALGNKPQLDILDLHEANANMLTSLGTVSASMITCLRTINEESAKLRQGQELLSSTIRQNRKY
jgi:hypothetical protein